MDRSFVARLKAAHEAAMVPASPRTFGNPAYWAVLDAQDRRDALVISAVPGVIRVLEAAYQWADSLLEHESRFAAGAPIAHDLCAQHEANQKALLRALGNDNE